MTERSRFWNGTAVGDATEASYDAPTEFAQVLMGVGSSAGIANLGRVIASLAATGALAVTTPGANTARVATGEAIVYGSWYQNDSNVDVTIPTPGGATRIDRIVLRKSWAAQTVRVTRIAGAEGGAAPALVQIIGTTWDFPLAQVSITTGGVMTFTDQRKGITRSITIDLQTDLDDAQPIDDGSLNRCVFKCNDTSVKYAFGMAAAPRTIIPGTAMTFKARWFMQTATTGNVVVDGNIELIPASGAAGSSVSIGPFTVAVPGTAGHMAEMNQLITTLSPSATDWINVRAGRQGSSGSDTATGDLNMIACVELEYESYA